MVEAITETAHAKVNLALHVLGRRADGYHELDSIVAFAGVGDRLTLTKAPTTRLLVTGSFAKDVPINADNLVLKAHALLSTKIDCPPVVFELEKNLPVASGIGGGSADAAAALRGLLRMTRHSLNRDDIAMIAKQLGADVPVCLGNSACRMRGIGDQLSGLDVRPHGGIVLVNPMIACGTQSVFKALGLACGQSYWTGVDTSSPENWRNDLTDAAIEVVPEIATVLGAIKSSGAFTAVRMSGSGATCFGLAENGDVARDAADRLRHDHPSWWVAESVLV